MACVSVHRSKEFHSTRAHAGRRPQRCAILSAAVAPVASEVPKAATANSEPWWQKRKQPNFVDVDGLQDLVATLQQNADKLVLVDFFAPWCNSCKSLYPKLSQLCEQNPQIVVAKMNFEKNRELAKKLGIKVLPYFHAYHGSMGRVASFSSSLTKIQRLKDCIALFGQPYCDLQEHEGKMNVMVSLPEFQKLPVPSDATELKFENGEYASAEQQISAQS